VLQFEAACMDIAPHRPLAVAGVGAVLPYAAPASLLTAPLPTALLQQQGEQPFERPDARALTRFSIEAGD
jgi:hypothetical protein